ncbi:MAG: MFS transporter [Bacteroidota bacterium]
MDKNIPNESTSPPKAQPYSLSYKRYVLLILTGVYAFNFIDRQILVILQEPIKADLGLSDTQLGLLTGLAFAALYVILGLPIARYADNNNRKNVVSLSLVVWSAMTAISGLAQNFTQILLARIGVGIGEAGGSPPAHSIISDYYEPARRATALSIYSTGVYIGIFLGFLIGGMIAKNYGWRVALFALGIPGIFYALLVYLTVKEPIKGGLDKNPTTESKLTTTDVIKLLQSKKTFVFLALATGFQSFGNFGIGNWLPSFLARSHGMDIQNIGIVLGILAALGGGLGTFSGGWMTDKLRKYSVKWYCWLPAIATIVNFLPASFVFFGNPTPAVLTVLGMSYFLSALYLGPSIAVTHSLVPAEMRAFASAVLFFVLNSLGMGLGPLVIGALSDWLEPTLGQDALRWAFTCTFISGSFASILFYLAGKNYEREVGEMSEE